MTKLKEYMCPLHDGTGKVKHIVWRWPGQRAEQVVESRV